MDVTALKSLRNIHAVCKRHGAVMILSHVNEQPMSVMEHAGFADEIGRDNFCANIDAALEHAKKYCRRVMLNEGRYTFLYKK